jgi:HNH endonuclease
MYFQANIGEPISKDELRYVSKIHAGPRRVRELEEAGWQIQSNLDRPELRPGEYMMIAAHQLPAKAREHIKLRFQILDRDNFRCVIDGAVAGAGLRLQVHHILPVENGGTNDPANLQTLCDACHAGKHAMLASEVKDDLLYPEDETALVGRPI